MAEFPIGRAGDGLDLQGIGNVARQPFASADVANALANPALVTEQAIKFIFIADKVGQKLLHQRRDVGVVISGNCDFFSYFHSKKAE